MQIVDIIHNKAIKKELTEQQIDQLINAIVDKSLPDYLITTWLMATYINGLSINEAYYLTKAMWKYSLHVDLTKYGRDIIDKHSTGGVGDKVSLILLPIIASCGLPVAKISGRGLGFTGGTIDKLESIGVNTNLTKKQMLDMLTKHKIFLAGQTKDLVPADKVLYNLRNATCTVDNYGLIASSILSKKFSILGTHVFLDVKYGSGAFCDTYDKAMKLIKYLVAIAKKMKRRLTIFLTDMNQPLGKTIGNAIEVLEAQKFLAGDKDYDHNLKELIYKIASTIIMTYDKKKSYKVAYSKVDHVIKSKLALNKFYEWLASQGANINIVKTKKYWHPKYQYNFIACRDGYLTFKSNASIGLICSRLGAGRILKTDKIDFQAGMIWHYKHGAKLNKGKCVMTCYSSKPINNDEIYHNVLQCLDICQKKPKPLPLIRKIIHV